MKELEKAEMVARWSHGDTSDMTGLPYWTHCHRVAGNLLAAGYDETIQAIGWLHDVVEDTDVSLDDLLDMGFSWRTHKGVEAMTQRKGEPLNDYWLRVRDNPDALAVKLYGDIPDNDEPTRKARMVAVMGKGGSKLAAKLTAKYKEARIVLRAEFPSEAVSEWTEPTLELMEDHGPGDVGAQ